MKYDPSKIIYDQQVAINATKLFDSIKSLLTSNTNTGEVLKEITNLNPEETVVLDTINLVLGWLTFPKEGDNDLKIYRGTIDILSQHLAGVEY